MANPESNHVPLCPLKAVTGLDCPFCGSLRAVQDLVHGDLAGAADHNVLFVASLPFLAIAWVSWLVRSSSGDDQRPVAPRWLLPTFLVAATAFAVLRNLPSMTWLASG
ncbi:MAG: DUF2752 domain-containing protein [Acidimicrobiales bacterium]|nr:DUF2752 domain-containing protein [Acidimicrobiales bacterium]